MHSSEWNLPRRLGSFVGVDGSRATTSDGGSRLVQLGRSAEGKPKQTRGPFIHDEWLVGWLLGWLVRMLWSSSTFHRNVHCAIDQCLCMRVEAIVCSYDVEPPELMFYSERSLIVGLCLPFLSLSLSPSSPSMCVCPRRQPRCSSSSSRTSEGQRNISRSRKFVRDDTRPP